MWKDLTMGQRADVISMAVITSYIGAAKDAAAKYITKKK